MLNLFGIERVTLPDGVDGLWEWINPEEFLSWKKFAAKAAVGFAATATAWGICRSASARIASSTSTR